MRILSSQRKYIKEHVLPQVTDMSEINDLAEAILSASISYMLANKYSIPYSKSLNPEIDVDGMMLKSSQYERIVYNTLVELLDTYRHTDKSPDMINSVSDKLKTIIKKIYITGIDSFSDNDVAYVKSIISSIYDNIPLHFKVFIYKESSDINIF